MNSLSAIKAYQAQMNRMQDMPRGTADIEADAPASAFGQLLSHAMDTTTQSLKAAESQQLKAITGQAELTDLVTAVTSAELSLNTVVAVRDRVINAYNDIIRMSI